MGTKSSSKAELEDRSASLVSPLENCTDREIGSRKKDQFNIFKTSHRLLCFREFRPADRENVQSLEFHLYFFPISLLPKTVSRQRSTRFASLTPLVSLVSSSSLLAQPLFPEIFPSLSTSFLPSSASAGLDITRIFRLFHYILVVSARRRGRSVRRAARELEIEERKSKG